MVSSIENRCSCGILVDPDEALVHEFADPVDDVTADLRCRPAHELSRLELEPAAEDRQPIDEAVRSVVEQVVAPGDRAAERLLTLRQVARAGREQVEVVLEPDAGSGPASGA